MKTKKRKLMAIAAFLLSLSMTLTVFTSSAGNEGGGGGDNKKKKPQVMDCFIGNDPLSTGACCIAGGQGCVPNSCPPGTTADDTQCAL